MKNKHRTEWIKGDIRKLDEGSSVGGAEGLDELSRDAVQKLIHELEVHQVELETQNEELHRAQAELEESRSEYADLYDFAPLGYFTLNKNAMIERVNLTGAALLRVGRESLITKSFVRYIARESQDVFYSYLRRLVDSATKQTCEFRMLRKDKTTFYAQLEGFAVFDGGGNFGCFRLAVLDVTERKQAEGSLRESEERYRHLFENVPIGIYRTTPDGRIVMANPALVRMLGYSSFEELALRNLEDGEELGPTYSRNQFKQVVEQEGEVRGLESAWLRRDSFMIFVRENARAVRGNDGAVLYYEGTVEDVTQHKMMEEALKENLIQLSKKNRYETIISAVTRSVHQSINLQEVLENAVESMSRNIDRAHNVSIYFVEGEEAVLRAYRGYTDRFVERAGRIQYPKGFTWKTIIDGKPIYCGDVDNDTVIGPAGREMGTKSYVSMPIQFEGKTVGCIDINSFENNAFDEDELKLLRIVAGQIETAINNAKQAEALRQSEEALRESLAQLSKKSRYETIISAVTRSVHQSINLQEVLENAAESMSKDIGKMSGVSIYLVEGEEAVVRAHRGYTDEYIERAGRIPYPKGATWKAILEGKPVYVADVDQDEVIGTAGREMGIKSYVVMPIHSEGTIAGTVGINSFEKNAFDEDELKLLGTVARQIEVAINNAKQAEALRQSEERYRVLFDQSPVGVYIFDKGYRITQCNEGMAEILRSTRDRIIGVDLTKLKNQCVQPLIEKVFEGESAVYEGLYEATNSSAKLWVSVHLSPLRDGDGEVIGGMAVVEDVSERKLAEEALRRSNEGLELRVNERTRELYEANEELKKEIAWRSTAEGEIKKLNENLERRAYQLEAANKGLEAEILVRKRAEEALRESLDQLSKKSRYETIVSTVTRAVHKSIALQDVLENAVGAMHNIDRANIVAIYLVEGRDAVLKAHKGFPDWFVKRIERIPNPRGFTWKTIIEGRPRYCADVDRDEVIGTAGRDAGIKSYLSMPLRFEGQTVGCVNISSFEKNAFDEDDLKLLGIVARQIEVAINNAKRAEALKQSEERYRALYEDNPTMYFTIDANGNILSVNRLGAKQLGYTVWELVGKPVLNVFYEGDKEEVSQQLNECLKNIGQVVHWEFRKVRKDGNMLWARESARAVRDSDGNTVVLVVCEEITKRKQAEEQIKASLKEKEVLLKEIQHRVKNNLQVISSLIDLQTEYLKNKKAIGMFNETHRRVRSMALIHEQLYQSKDLAKINFAEYIRSLGDYLFQSFGVKSDGVKLKVNVDKVLIDVDTAISCGLIINELVSNSLKHAFPKATPNGGRGKSGGEIRISLSSNGSRRNNPPDGSYTLAVGDNGVGFPENLDFRNTKSLGLQLVNTLTEQLGGTIELNRNRGTVFRIRFSQ